MNDDDNNKNLKNLLPNLASEEVEDEFSQKMKNIGIKEKEREAKAKSDSLNYPYIDLKGFPISPETISSFTEEQAKQLSAVCFFRSATDIRIGALDPRLPELQDLAHKLEQENHANVKFYVISEESLKSALRLYGALPKLRKFVSGVEITGDDVAKFEQTIKSMKDLNDQLKSVSITDMITLMIAAAIKARSSDIHIEAEEDDVKIRYRIDGILHDVATLEKKVWPQVAARVKLIAKLKINVEDRPQDGRFTIFMTDGEVDVRVSALPTAHGESVVMRLLMSSSVGLSFESLGLRGKAYEALKRESEKPNGMILTTGPTGSGKTTTLYAILNKLNDPETKIITIEDPVEYKLLGINQSQVDPSKHYTFANGLRSILRQDPDIVMVGEIRDLETAEIAINAALTGHLVISTLHTNDASGTIPRLLSIGVKPYVLAPAINAMIGQRLVRRICEDCKETMELDSETMSRVMQVLKNIPESSGSKIPDAQLKQLKFYHGRGCEQCQGLGYKGRIGVYEVMTMSKEVESLVLSGHVSEYDMREVGKNQGMVTMIQDGLLKAAEGITTVDEVFRVAKDVNSML